jgi:hypothetical protein
MGDRRADEKFRRCRYKLMTAKGFLNYFLLLGWFIFLSFSIWGR